MSVEAFAKPRVFIANTFESETPAATSANEPGPVVEPQEARSLNNPTLTSVASAEPAPAHSLQANPKGDFEIDIEAENIKHAIGIGAVCRNGELEFNSGIIVEGQILGGSIKVNGTLVLKSDAKITAKIDCQRLILMGDIDSELVVVHGLIVAWAGKLRAKKGIYCDAFESSSACKISGSLKDLADLARDSGQ